jgi:hypothetical protein
MLSFDLPRPASEPRAESLVLRLARGQGQFGECAARVMRSNQRGARIGEWRSPLESADPDARVRAVRMARVLSLFGIPSLNIASRTSQRPSMGRNSNDVWAGVALALPCVRACARAINRAACQCVAVVCVGALGTFTPTLPTRPAPSSFRTLVARSAVPRCAFSRSRRACSAAHSPTLSL